MSALNTAAAPPRPAPRDAAWRVTVGILALLTLLAIWSCFPDSLGGTASLAGFTVMVLGACTIVCLIAFRHAIVGADHAQMIKVGVVSIVALVTCVWLIAVGWRGLLVSVLFAVLGASLIGYEARMKGDSRASLFSRSGWELITDGPNAPAGIYRELAGAVLLSISMLLFGLFVMSLGNGAPPALLFWFLVLGAFSAAMVGIFARRVGVDDRTSADIEGLISRQTVSAHLHDSVLQTLALIQRKADDPEAVSRLARRQEASLRLWLAGSDERGQGSVAAALQDSLEQVEDEESVTIDATIMGNAQMNEQSTALVGAVREALRNAARHADANTISLYVEMNDNAIEAFVRDDGSGFDAKTVTDQRRGIRDSIVARMATVGGWAQVQSNPGEGTEVQMTTKRHGGQR